jgi:hypothetical protein
MISQDTSNSSQNHMPDLRDSGGRQQSRDLCTPSVPDLCHLRQRRLSAMLRSFPSLALNSSLWIRACRRGNTLRNCEDNRTNPGKGDGGDD